MKRLMNSLVLIVFAFIIAACSQAHASVQSEWPMQSSVQEPSAAPSQASVIPEAEPSATTESAPFPLPTGITQDLIGSLPDPALWTSSLHMDGKDFPRLDGSTATIPLGIFIRAKVTGETLEHSLVATNFTKTGPAWLALASNKADLLIVYEAPDMIRQQMEESRLTVKPIGVDALVFLTNKGNSVQSLTQKQIVGIYTGKIKKWSQVGGQNRVIIPYQRISNSGSQALMLKLVMKDRTIMDAPQVMKPTEMGDLINDIASYDNSNNALGYSVYYYVRNMYTLPGIQLLAVDGIAPTSDTIASGAYPYVNPFYAAIRADEPADSQAHKLFDWLTGAEGKRAIKDAGYVPAN